MLKLFYPTYYFSHAWEITPEFLRAQGIRAVLSDLDDTLTCHDSQELAPEYAAWLARLQAEGIALCILSNNAEARIRPFCERNGLQYTPKAKKPLRAAALATAERLGAKPEETLLLGDQIFTDILCGKNAGMRTAAVPPIGRKATKFIAFKRWVEKPVWRAYFRQRKEEV
ncbi:MAG: YqeG family HAD IIIA-type phosphatase [Clostridia bacterium]|nr:YqeG family HAD IIIA-type phosphatase [Clostridia bacterium]